MTNLLAILFPILLQIDFNTPTWPDLNSPTPFVTPTPNATSSVGMDDAPTVEVPQNDMLNNLSTVEARVNVMPTAIVANGSQLYWQGRPVLPDTSGSATTWTYFKWLTSSAGYSVFGPFQPIMIHLGILVSLAILSLIIYYGQLFIQTVFEFVWWVVRTILRFIPFIG